MTHRRNLPLLGRVRKLVSERRCPACGRVIHHGQRKTLLHGETWHEKCLEYRRKQT